jgi:glycosyltransferase involved in cell wall biosynthesis
VIGIRACHHWDMEVFGRVRTDGTVGSWVTDARLRESLWSAMSVRFIQPYPDHSCPIQVPPDKRVRCGVPVYHVRYRCGHHSPHSGYDRLCDYVGDEVRLPRWLYWMGETVLRIPALALARLSGQFEYGRHDVVMEFAALRHFRRHSNSVYHCVYGEKSYRMLSRVAGTRGNKLVVTVHHPPEHNSWLFQSRDRFRRADHIVVVSSKQIPYWQEVAGPDRVSFIPYAVDSDYFVPSAEVPKTRQCIFVGTHERDFDTLNRLIKHVLLTVPESSFLLISRDRRCALFRTLGERVIWRERIAENEYRHSLQASALLVLPLRYSTTCTTVLEALACGIPVVTNVGGIEDYLSESCSMLYKVGDAEGMANGVTALLTNPARLGSMSQAARAQGVAFSWPNAARKMACLYERLFALQQDRPHVFEVIHL